MFLSDMRRVDRREGDTPEVKREAQSGDRCRCIELYHDTIGTGGVDSKTKGTACIVSQVGEYVCTSTIHCKHGCP